MTRALGSLEPETTVTRPQVVEWGTTTAPGVGFLAQSGDNLTAQSGDNLIAQDG